MTTSTISSRPTTHPVVSRRTAALAGILGPTVFCIVFTLHGFLLGDEYDPVAEPVSALEAADAAWVQQANFVWLALCLGLFAVGLHRHVRPARLRRTSGILLATMPLGLVLAAALPLREDATGATYDPGGHFVSGVTFFLGSALALVVMSRRMRDDDQWRSRAAYTLTAGCVALGCFVLMGGFVIPDDAPLHAYAGAIQRATLLLVTFPCIVTLALRMMRLPEAATS
jgi:hypothetical protein